MMIKSRIVRRYIRLVGRLVTGLVVGATWMGPHAQAQVSSDWPPATETNPSSPPEKQATPLAIMQQNKGALAPGLRAVVNFSKAGKGCRPWHFEVAAHSDARIVFQIKEPQDRGIVLATRVDEKAYQVLLGDSACQFGVRIERVK